MKSLNQHIVRLVIAPLTIIAIVNLGLPASFAQQQHDCKSKVQKAAMTGGCKCVDLDCTPHEEFDVSNWWECKSASDGYVDCNSLKRVEVCMQTDCDEEIEFVPMLRCLLAAGATTACAASCATPMGWACAKCLAAMFGATILACQYCFIRKCVADPDDIKPIEREIFLDFGAGDVCPKIVSG